MRVCLVARPGRPDRSSLHVCLCTDPRSHLPLALAHTTCVSSTLCSLLAVAVLATANAAKTYQKFADQRCHGFKNIPAAYYKRAAPLAGTTTPSMTVADCQAICEKNSTCVSFEMRVGIKNGYTWCSGSASCAPSNGVTLATTATDVNYKYTTYVLSSASDESEHNGQPPVSSNELRRRTQTLT